MATLPRQRRARSEMHHAWQPRPLGVQSGRVTGGRQGGGVLPVRCGTESLVPRTHLTPWSSHVSAHGDDRLAALWSAAAGEPATTPLPSPHRGLGSGSNSHSARIRSPRKHPRTASPRLTRGRHARLRPSASIRSDSQRQGSGDLTAPWSVSTCTPLWAEDAGTSETRAWLEEALKRVLGHDLSEAAWAARGDRAQAKSTASAPIGRARLAAVQNVFEHLVEEFRTCKQLLSAIKSEYDTVLRYWIGRHDGDKPRYDRSRSLRELMQSELAQIHESHALEVRPLEDAIAATRDRMERAHHSASLMQRRLQEHQGALGKTKRGLDENEETDHDLLSVMRRLERQLYQQQIQWETDLGPKVKQLRNNIEEKTADIAAAKKYLKWAWGQIELENASIELELKAQQRLERDCEQISSEIEELDLDTAKYERLTNDMEEKMKRVLKGSISTGRSTPRPQWDNAADTVMVSMELQTDKRSSADIVNQLVDHLRTDNRALREIYEQLDAVQRQEVEKRQKGTEDMPKWHICLGTGPGVPKYLQRIGRVRNMQLSKRATEELINDFWKARLKHDSQPSAIKLSTAVFLHGFLFARCGSKGAAVELGYNLADAIRRHSYDADCELFGRILHGEVCEDAYYEQTAFASGFVELCARAEATEVEDAERRAGIISRGAFLGCMDKHFRMTTPSQLRALKKALSYQFPLQSEIPYRELFASDEDGNQGKFAETMRDEHLYMMLQEYPNVENAIRKVLLETLEADPQVTPMTEIDTNEWRLYSEVIQTVPMFRSFGPESIKELVKLSHVCEYKDGDHIIVQATVADTMYIMVKGKAYVQKDGHKKLHWSYANANESREDGTRNSAGNFFGEGALLAPRRARATDPMLPLRGASIIAAGAAGVTCLRVSREAFLQVSDMQQALRKRAVEQGKGDTEGDNVGTLVSQEIGRLQGMYARRDEASRSSNYTTRTLHQSASNRIMSKARTTAPEPKSPASESEQEPRHAVEAEEVALPPVVCQVQHVQAGLRRNDPKIPQAEINRILAAGFNTPISGLLVNGRDINSTELFDAETGISDLHVFMTTIKRSVVLKRYSQLPEEEPDVIQQKFLRSLPLEEKKAIEDMFNAIDVDFSGSISTTELRSLLLDTYGMHPTQAQLAKLTAQIDADGDGSITLDEFTRAMGNVPELQKVGDMFKWKSMFIEADEDKSGSLDFAEVCNLVVRISYMTMDVDN